ncbi:MAG: hypothetical protein KDA55_06420, partial [Planctomycetales bacterium]|nr:hypothetical protein [Planctomycetales bacterium]
MRPAASRIGLPTLDILKRYRIWDSYFTPAHAHPGRDGASQLLADIELALRTADRAAFERLCYFGHVGIGTTGDPEVEALLRSRPELILKPLERWPDRLLGMFQLNAYDGPGS